VKIITLIRAIITIWKVWKAWCFESGRRINCWLWIIWTKLAFAYFCILLLLLDFLLIYQHTKTHTRKT